MPNTRQIEEHIKLKYAYACRFLSTKDNTRTQFDFILIP